MARINHPHRLDFIRRDLRLLSASDVLLIAAVMVSSWYASTRLIQLAGA